MAKKAAVNGSGEKIIDLGKLNPKQAEAFRSTAKFTCYGGAKAGGKSHFARMFAIKNSFGYPGINILFLRATYDDIRQNQIEPILKLLPNDIYSYNGSTHKMTIYTDGDPSSIQFGNWSGVESENKYQGQEYDIIIIDEATQFTERMFRHLAGCLRGNVGKGFPKRMILTCNPGGIGHFWVKRLFIDRKFITDKEHPEKSENPLDYQFIFAKAEDNIAMLQENAGYLEDVSKMSNSDALRYGFWDIMAGQYFDNFVLERNTTKAFNIPPFWERYRSFDYGLDKFACFWWAVDEDGRSWCIRSFEESGLNVQDAARKALEHTLPGEKISVTYAPPDMWSRQKDTGRTMADIFITNGLPIVKADNNRVQGHMIMRSLLEPIPLTDPYVIKMYGGKDKAPKELPALMFFDNVGQVLEDIQSIQHDENNPNDCAKQPHDVTHTIDGMRYFCISRSLKAEAPKKEISKDSFIDDDAEDYYDYMTGGEISESYIGYSA